MSNQPHISSPRSGWKLHSWELRITIASFHFQFKFSLQSDHIFTLSSLLIPAPPLTMIDALLPRILAYTWSYYEKAKDYKRLAAERDQRLATSIAETALENEAPVHNGDTNVEVNNEESTISQTSSGFHLFELSMPAIGTSVAVIFAAALVIIFIIWLTYKCCAAHHRKRARQAAMEQYALQEYQAPASAPPAPMRAPVGLATTASEFRAICDNVEAHLQGRDAQPSAPSAPESPETRRAQEVSAHTVATLG